MDRRKLIQLTCDGCGEVFDRPIKLHRSNIKRGRKIVACSVLCQGKAQRINRERVCGFCNKIFLYKDTDQLFCDRTCADNSRRKPKIDAIKKLRGVNYSLTTLQMLKNRYAIGEFHAKLRGHARSIYKQSGRPLECFSCGYNLHVDVCHIQDVKDFPLDTLVSVVNDIDNLVALDKRCHWEFDHGYLKI